jgi:hypothetical protein
MYPRCDIDKVRERGETWAVDPEMREALDRFAADLRGEIRSTKAETHAYVDERIQDSTASLLHQILDQIRESESGTRRHFDVVAESLRGDIRAVAEGMAASREQTGRTDGLEGRVQRLEVRVSGLEADRKPRRPRRR